MNMGKMDKKCIALAIALLSIFAVGYAQATITSASIQSVVFSPAEPAQGESTSVSVTIKWTINGPTSGQATVQACSKLVSSALGINTNLACESITVGQGTSTPTKTYTFSITPNSAGSKTITTYAQDATNVYSTKDSILNIKAPPSVKIVSIGTLPASVSASGAFSIYVLVGNQVGMSASDATGVSLSVSPSGGCTISGSTTQTLTSSGKPTGTVAGGQVVTANFAGTAGSSSCSISASVTSSNAGSDSNSATLTVQAAAGPTGPGGAGGAGGAGGGLPGPAPPTGPTPGPEPVEETVSTTVPKLEDMISVSNSAIDDALISSAIEAMLGKTLDIKGTKDATSKALESISSARKITVRGSKSEVQVFLQNKGNDVLKDVFLVEAIPKSEIGNLDTLYNFYPRKYDKIIREDPMIVWDFEEIETAIVAWKFDEIQPGESVSVSYSVNKVLDAKKWIAPIIIVPKPKEGAAPPVTPPVTPPLIEKPTAGISPVAILIALVVIAAIGYFLMAKPAAPGEKQKEQKEEVRGEEKESKKKGKE